MASIETFTIDSEQDGLALSVCLVEPELGEPKALVQLAHGMSEHKECYIPFMEYLAEHGYACLINDHRGHGASVRSPEDLGYFYEDGAEAMVGDLHQLTLWFRERYPGKKLFLFGHSMGSLAGRVYRQRYDGDIDGLIVCGTPGINLAAGLGLPLNRAMTAFRGDRYISGLFVGMTTGVFKKGAPRNGSANQNNAHRHDDDPLCGFPLTLNGYRALLELMREASRPVPAMHPDLPVHFLSGEEDPCAPNEKGFNKAVRRVRKDGYINVTSKMYPGMRHDLLHHRDHMVVYEDLLAVLEGWV